MPLTPGTRIGGYEVGGLLGAGGMGEVYRARDGRLGRDVAIKIISPRIAADADAASRFEREARTLASVNHPHIAAIYDVVEHQGRPALVLELVEGETLADRVAGRPLPLDQALDYARQLTDALDTAHEAGIVHRDLKPANIKITHAHQLKILDFGLAKAIAVASGESAADPANAPTVTVEGTREGIVLGSAPYMSPEQARGGRVDKRTDIWAFGCVLFEMLTGRRAFGGATTSDVIAAIIERSPDLSRLPRSTPDPVRRVVARCLEKDPKKRARDIADVRAELDAPFDVSARPRRATSRTLLYAAIAAALIVAGGLVAWPALRPAAEPGEPVEFTFGPPPGHSLQLARPSVSPDGRHIAFIALDDERIPSLWIRSLGDGVSRRLPATENVQGAASWSPDGRSIAFMANDAWRRTTVDGGPVVTIVPDVVANIGFSWGAEDQILLSPANRTSLSRVSATDGVLHQATTLDSSKENSHRWPEWLPDDRHFLFTVRSDRPENLGIKIGAIDSGDVRTLVNVASPGLYAEPGYLLFITPDEALMAQRLAPSSWILQGAAQPVAAPVAYNGPSFNGMFDASADGRVLAYVPASRVPSALFWFDRTGQSLGQAAPERHYRGVRASSDGKAIAVELADDRYGTRDLWMVDPSSQALTRLTTNAATDWRPVFSPDRSIVAFASDRSGASTIFRTSPGGGAESPLYRNPDGGAFPTDWSRDGRILLATVDDRQGRSSGIVLIPVDGGSPVKLLDGTSDGAVASPRISNDGEHVAFSSNMTGTPEIYVISIRDRRRVRISSDGGSNPVWGNGRELFFLNPRDELMHAVLTPDATALTRIPERLFVPCASVQRTFSAGAAELFYDATADGSRFLVKCDPPAAAPTAITVVLNWQRRLR